jgi:hypothetical protein
MSLLLSGHIMCKLTSFISDVGEVRDRLCWNIRTSLYARSHVLILGRGRVVGIGLKVAVGVIHGLHFVAALLVEPSREGDKRDNKENTMR